MGFYYPGMPVSRASTLNTSILLMICQLSIHFRGGWYRFDNLLTFFQPGNSTVYVGDSFSLLAYNLNVNLWLCFLLDYVYVSRQVEMTPSEVEAASLEAQMSYLVSHAAADEGVAVAVSHPQAGSRAKRKILFESPAETPRRRYLLRSAGKVEDNEPSSSNASETATASPSEKKQPPQTAADGDLAAIIAEKLAGMLPDFLTPKVTKTVVFNSVKN